MTKDFLLELLVEWSPEWQAEQDAFEAEKAQAEANRIANRCKRCGGSGIIDGYWYNEGGRCFSCNK